MCVQNAFIASEMVRCGFGYSIFFQEELWKDKPGLYVQPLTHPDGSIVMREEYIAYRQESENIRAIQAFVNFAMDYAAEHYAQ